jgi:hypothetical protein
MSCLFGGVAFSALASLAIGVKSAAAASVLAV